jgi:hypothetical protein
MKSVILATQIQAQFSCLSGVNMIEDLSRYHQPVGTLLAGRSADGKSTV